MISVLLCKQNKFNSFPFTPFSRPFANLEMQCAFFAKGFEAPSHPVFSRGLRGILYSTKALISTATEDQRDTLCGRVSPVSDQSVSIVPVLDQWILEGKSVEKVGLIHLIVNLKRCRRFSHALQVSHWMSDQRYFVLSPVDIAVRLDLINKIHGVEQAEKYFHNIPEKSKVPLIYGSLLNCYVRKKSVEKAEALMQHMRDSGVVRSSAMYNALLKLYMQVGQYDKIDTLTEEMKGMGFIPDRFTFSSQLRTYAATSNIDGMEKILVKLDSNAVMDWRSCALAADGYIKAGLLDKASEMLKRLEKMITYKDRKSAYDFLLTLYAAAGRKEDMYRIWNYCKLTGKLYNTSFNSMITAVLKFGDIAAAEKILEEWEAGDHYYDFWVINPLIIAYCKSGLLKEAEILVNKAIEKGEKPFANTLDILGRGFVETNQIPKAVETMKAALLASQPGWKPCRETLATCLIYLKQQGDAEKTEEFLRVFQVPCHMTIDDCDGLLNYIYMINRKPESAEVNLKAQHFS